MPAKLRVVIVDDEPLAREGIRSLLSSDASVRIVAECRDGIDAIRFLGRHTADLLFLDIQMPEVNGFEVLEAIHPPPIIIFITAFDKYAVEAFSVHAFDYLLKPIDPDRFTAALERAKKAFERDRRHLANAKLAELLTAMREREGRPEKLMVRSGGRIHFLEVSGIEWIEAAGDYACLHVREKKFLTRETMQALEARLDGGRFCRIHRSTIVNTGNVKEVQPLAHGEAVLHLLDGTRLSVSRSYRQHLLSRLS